MKRREFLTLAGAAAAWPVSWPVAWPVAARAQNASIPMVGFVRASTAEGSAHLIAGFKQGLQEAGFIEGESVTIEYRWANGRNDRLGALAAELIAGKAAVLVGGASAASLAVKKATSTIPVVFVTTADPVKFGLVASLDKPGGNATGVTYLGAELGGERLELLHEMAPAIKSFAVLTNRNNPMSEAFASDVETAGRRLGLEIVSSPVAREDNLDALIASLARRRVGGMIFGSDPAFTTRAARLTELAANNGMPAIYTTREFVDAGGLMSWGTSLPDQYRLAGIYAGRILKGEKPADLPVQLATKNEFVLSLAVAKALRLEVPASLRDRADTVIE